MNLELHHGDCLDVLRRLGISPHLVYLDPPFFTGRTFCTREGTPAFSDRWRSLGDYIDSIRAVAEVVFPNLQPSWSFVVHVDQRASHYVKVAIDSVFGAHRFASEIIWRYRRWPAKTPNFQRVHDVLLRWASSPCTWNQLYETASASTLKTWGTGRQKAVMVEGKRKRSIVTDQASPGVPMGDVWDIPILAPMSKERTGYPTQKPEVLLERLILATTNPGDLVLDPYCGSGTTLAVANRLGRSSVGIDLAEEAIRVAKLRLFGD